VRLRVLADAGSGRLRLWQIVRSEATLRERVAAACQPPEAGSDLPVERRGRELLLRELSPQLRELRRARVDYADVVSRIVAEFAAREAPARWLSEIAQST
jgi:hypothetical protein